MTPLKYYGRTNIGSRPSRRNAALSLDSLRAIPFVGAWSQMKQNVPGYYGLGSALKELADEGFEEALRTLYHRNLFFRTLMENSMQSLSKAYFPLTSYLQADTEYGDFYGIIRDEAKLSADMLGRITGQTRLLDRRSGGQGIHPVEGKHDPPGHGDTAVRPAENPAARCHESRSEAPICGCRSGASAGDTGKIDHKKSDGID